jgi:hypothetical protein
MTKSVITRWVVYEMRYFHYGNRYYSEQDDCQAQYMGDPRGTHSKETQLWTPLTDEQARVYWDRCNCGLKESVEFIMGGGTR